MIRSASLEKSNESVPVIMTVISKRGPGACLQREFLGPRPLRFLGQHHFKNQDPRALAHRRDRALEDLDAVRIAQIVEDPAEGVNVLALTVWPEKKSCPANSMRNL